MFSPLQVKLNPSKQLTYLLCGFVLLAVCSIWLSGLPWLVQACLLVVLTGLSVHWLNRYILLRDVKSVQALRWSADNQKLAVCLPDQHWCNVVKIEERLVVSGFVALRLLPETEQSGHLNVWIMPDSVTNKEAFRRLKVLSRFAKVKDTRIPAG